MVDEWRRKESEARELMLNRKLSGRGSLIEVAAQHPLLYGKYPGEEFRKRLDLAVRISQPDSVFYVPGSLHKGDSVALGEAGSRYLQLLGTDVSRIVTLPDVNVYNSTAECEQASKLFKEGNYAELHCVCGSAQEMRKALSYIMFGCIPYFHVVSCDSMFHSYVEEASRNVPILLSGDVEAEFKRLEKERRVL